MYGCRSNNNNKKPSKGFSILNGAYLLCQKIQVDLEYCIVWYGMYECICCVFVHVFIPATQPYLLMGS